MIKFNVASINCCTETEGPNKRLSIWFQGCMLNCKGCCNPAYQALESRNIISLEKLVNIIKEAKEMYQLEGVTYLGGEPTLQTNLPLLTKEIKELNLGVIAFTGRRYEDVSDVLCDCDLVIDGPYIEELHDTRRRIIGSKNQRILKLTNRYDDYEEWFNNVDKRVVEININDYIVANGDAILKD